MREIVFASVLVFISFGATNAFGQEQSGAASGDLAHGQQLFRSTCAACHGLDGGGGEHGPDIATKAGVRDLPYRDLARIVRNGIPAAGMPGFASSLENTQIMAIVKYLRFLQGRSEAVSVAGDTKRGETLFFGKARCSECHVVNGQDGGFLGADLSGYGPTHSPAQIREWILDPNKNLDQRRGTVTVVTHAGKKYTGIVRNEDNFSLQMQTPDGNFHFFDKSELAQIDHEARSLMPSDYGSRLTKTDLDDLVSYLVKLRRTQNAETASNDDDDQ